MINRIAINCSTCTLYSQDRGECTIHTDCKRFSIGVCNAWSPRRELITDAVDLALRESMDSGEATDATE